MSDQITVEFDVPATMRDGTILRANIFRPAEGGPYPVALTRTPYGKDFSSTSRILDAVRLARAGYIVVIQDVRGRFTSEGEWALLRHEAQDGYESVEWAARLPGSNGNVGMFGASYFGFTQWAAAGQAPPSLKAIVPFLTWADARDGNFWRGGALEFGLLADWHLKALAFDLLFRRYAKAPPAEQAQVIGALVQEIDHLRVEGYFSLPLKDFEPLKRLDIFPDGWAAQLAQPNSRALSVPYSPFETQANVQVAAYNVGGWYDIFCNGTLQNFSELRANGATSAARQSKLLVGPWHHLSEGNVIGEMDFGFAANASFINVQFDPTGLTQRWFDYWLKGIDNGITQEPPVKLFIMGENVWRAENEWPLARTRYTPFYLHTAGFLSPDQPADEAPDHYLYDPHDPTPTAGGALLMHPLFTAGVKDQRSVEGRSDVLGFTSAPLAQDVEVTGPVIVKLWAASDAPDTDFVARLVDVHPNGFAQNLCDGIIRARYRNGESAEPLEAGRAYEFTIDLWATANLFKAGHCIRLDLTSSNFPRWDRNPNTGHPFGTDSELRPARQTILHDAAHPSHIILPIIPR